MPASQNATQETTPSVPPESGAASRIVRLLALATASGPLRIREAARALGVSEMTVRRDLAGAGTLICLGGYIALARTTIEAPLYALDREKNVHAPGKRAAAEAAARHVRAGETVFIDCGTTMPYLAASLPTGIPLTVVCYALNIATIVCRRPETRVVLLGGLYHGSSASFWSREGEHTLSRIGINRAFLSAGGIHRERGVSCSNFHEVPLKQVAMRNAEHCCLVADASKFDQVKPAFFAELSAFDRIVTDDSLTLPLRRRFGGSRPVLELAPPASGPSASARAGVGDAPNGLQRGGARRTRDRLRDRQP